MKKIIVLVLPFFFLFASCANKKTIVVTNNTSDERLGEMIEIQVAHLNMQIQPGKYILRNEAGEEVPYQLIYNNMKMPQQLIFQVTAVKANSSATFIFKKGTPADVHPKTWARYVPERKDDFAWENDLAAYRMYGPALAKENPSNGVDLWLKRTDELIVDKFYHDELKNGLSYHVDHGAGLDCYKVGHTLGAGGIAPYAANTLWVGNNYSSQRVIETGPLRSAFVLIYDSVRVGDRILKEHIVISTDAGAVMNKAVVTYLGHAMDIELAAGIFLHDKMGVLKLDAATGTAAYAEDAVSEANIPSGRNYVGVYVPTTVTDARSENDHALLLSKYRIGETFTYYFGGGWSKWGFETDEDWFNAVEKFAFAKQHPLQVTIN